MNRQQQQDVAAREFPGHVLAAKLYAAKHSKRVFTTWHSLENMECSSTNIQVGNDAQIYEIRKKIHKMKQEELTVVQYYVPVAEAWLLPRFPG